MIQDLSGQRFNRLTVLSFAGMDRGNSLWHCHCECGGRVIVRGPKLKSGHTKSCGCLQRERTSQAKTGSGRHNGYLTTEYAAWRNMKYRCNTRTAKAYPRYGGRGIRVCERWETFENFLADMGPRPSPKHSIDRINNEGDYEPANCRWVIDVEQMNNRAVSKKYTHDSKTLSLPQWSRETGIDEGTILSRVNAGWPLHLALTKPTNRKHSLIT